jgi:AcrR family transcriptional regulator
VTTRAVAEAAGVQAPTIYRLFGDENGLLDAVAEHGFASYLEDKRPAGPGRRPGREPARRVGAAHQVAEAGRLRVTERRAVDLIHAAGTGVVSPSSTRPPLSALCSAAGSTG